MINLIFDMDGCLIDSKEVQKAAFYGSYKEIVGDDNCPTYEEYIKHTGESVDNVLKKMGLPAEMATPYRRISSEAVDKIDINWKAVELIQELHKLGSKVAIVTGKDHYRALEILKYYKIETLFDALVGSDDVSNPKPSSDPMLKAMNLMMTNPKNTIAIGDGYNDILSAKEAGIKSVLTLWYGDEHVPREADYVVYSVDELKKIIFDCAQSM